ncbi:MAG: universal stress protein [Aestuariivirga sp.]|uniref:universal stress protein n=1 Tax=Aestuariivirga sp. TaxID=2650926 RepID=UPI0038CF554F
MTKKILCATDGTEHSAHAVELAATLAARLGARLSICAVNVAHGGARGPLIYAWEDDQVKKVLDSAAAVARQAGAHAVEELALRSREAASAIVQYAEENGFDHIVVGTGDKRGVSRLVLGSVAADVAGRAHCSVTVAR